jgi:hypothetical protein
MAESSAARLKAAIIAAGVAITDIASIGTEGVAATVAVVPSSLQAAAQPTIDAFDWSDAAQAVWENLQARTQAIAFLADAQAEYKLARAIADAARDSDNVLRAWDMSFKAAVAASTSFADLKTRIAALPNLPDISNATLRTAITNRVTDGTVDT